MPQTNVRDLVQHASRHGYLVSSFTVNGADEIQAVVTAAEANRAPAIIAVENPSGSFVDPETRIAVAASIIARATVPVAIEVVSGTGSDQRRVAWPAHASNVALEGLTADDRAAVACDVEAWAPADGCCGSMAADRFGVAFDDEGKKCLQIGLVRNTIERIRYHFDGPLVVNGDLAWRDGTLPALPRLGVAKINFDRRLRRSMARANRSIAQKAGDDFRCAMDHVAAALIAEVTECLRNTGATGRAADVIACAARVYKHPQHHTARQLAPAKEAVESLSLA